MIASVIIASLGLLGFGAFLRWFGLIAVNKSIQTTAPTPSRPTIEGFFWASIAFAILALIARSVIQMRVTGTSGELGILIVGGLIYGVLMTLAAYLALTDSARLSRGSGVVCTLVLLAAVFAPWSIFVFGVGPGRLPIVGNWVLILAVLSIPFAATYFLLLPYRLRGWRLSWPNNESVA